MENDYQTCMSKDLIEKLKENIKFKNEGKKKKLTKLINNIHFKLSNNKETTYNTRSLIYILKVIS